MPISRPSSISIPTETSSTASGSVDSGSTCLEFNTENGYFGNVQHDSSQLDVAKDGPDKPSDELPPGTASTSGRSALVSICLFHLPPMAMTMLFLALYLADTRWDASSTQLKALLYAAKLHETIIIVSLSDILYHRVRYKLLCGDGMPFGFLTSPFQFSNPVFIFSKSFRGATKSWRTRNDAVTVGLVVVCFLLGILAGPSSGIILLPKLDWWLLDGRSQEYALFRASHPDLDLHPLSSQGLYPTVLNTQQLIHPDRWTSMKNSLPSWMNTTQRYITNVTVDRYPGLLSLGGSRSHSGSATLVFATAPLDMLSSTLRNSAVDWTSVSLTDVLIRAVAVDKAGTERPWKQPVVSMDCRGETVSQAKSMFEFPADGIFPRATITMDGLPHPGFQTNASSRLLGSSDANITTKVSASLLITTKDGYHTLCLVDARWRESDAWITTPYLTVSQDGIGVDPWSVHHLDLEDKARIVILPDVLNLPPPVVLNLTPPVFDVGEGLDVGMSLAAQCQNESIISGELNYDGQTPCIAAMSAMVLTDMLRSVPMAALVSDGRPKYGTWNPSNVPGELRVEMRLHGRMHAYRFEGVLLYLALGVLFSHFLLAWSQVLLLSFGERWHCRAWGDLGELLALGVTTPAPEFRKESGWLDKDGKFWGVRIFVGASEEKGKAQLVFRGGPGSEGT